MIFARRSRRGRIRIAAAVLGCGLALFLAWCAGFIWFSQQIPRRVEQPALVTDAIVVLTGRRASTGNGYPVLGASDASN